MLGVDAFEESSLVIKILMRTLPSKQWIVRREFLRRLKNRFDELGIDMALPTRRIIREYQNDTRTEPEHDDREAEAVKEDMH
jgi:small conductance mechanosensitive channel